MGQNRDSNRVEAMTVDEIFEAIDSGMAEVEQKLASGELDGSGRFFTDEELAASGLLKKDKENPKKGKSAAAPAA